MEAPSPELGPWLRLSLTTGIGRDTARRLLAAFGEPSHIFRQSESSLRQVVSAAQAHALLQTPDDWPALMQATQDWLQTGTDPMVSRAVITLGDARYPSSMLDMPDPPLMLHALGQVSALQGLDRLCAVAMVGSRNPTPQGLINAREFASNLSASGLVVVSGMALGIDGAAHEGALQGAPAGALATIAVVGTGLDRVYPKQHRDLAHRIALRGVILSEYPLGTPPLAHHFPQRNRLISGLSQATLVVEAALPSGSLITARQALEQGRDVMAIPGSIHSAQAKGCHALIKQGAKLIESAQDVLEELRLPSLSGQRALDLETPPNAQSTTQPSQSEEDSLLSAMGHDPVGLDALQARTGWPTAQLQAQLLELELMGQVGRLPGGLFQRMSAA